MNPLLARVGIRRVNSAEAASSILFRTLSTGSPPAASPSAVNHPKTYQRGPDEIRLDNHTRAESQYKLGKHRSNAMELVHKIPPIEVDGDMAICDGGGGAMGHPLEYISLERPGAIEYCKYCGLRYTKMAK